jgi:hypothetical protein
MCLRPIIGDPNHLAPFRNTRRSAHEQWKAKCLVITDLYVRRQMTLKEVMKWLENNYGLLHSSVSLSISFISF